MFYFVSCIYAICLLCNWADRRNNLTDSATSAEKTVSVVRGTITPTVSTQTTIVPAVPFIISSPENGIFNTAVELEEKITAGQIIGTVNGKELKSPVDGTITSIAPSNESVPSNYPVAIVHYTGFALNVEADNFEYLTGVCRVESKISSI